jgi:endonuclease/exonuclease/phosphatase family metal-dependent hydrolase
MHSRDGERGFEHHQRAAGLKFRILTFNAGLPIFCGGRIQLAPQIAPRFAVLAKRLREVHADLILLQEVYDSGHRKSLETELRNAWPWAACERKKRAFGFNNSLMAFSRCPITGRVERFRAAPFDEKIFEPKGFLVCRIQMGPHAALTVLNVHTTAGGLWQHPESARVDQIRDKQIHQILSAAEREKGVVMITGDFNAGPGVSEANFRSMREAGYESVYDRLHPSSNAVTWDPTNRLNVSGPHRMCPQQRIDHVFVRTADIAANRVLPIESAICLREEMVRGSDGRDYTVSDHFGLWVDLEVGLCETT